MNTSNATLHFALITALMSSWAGCGGPSCIEELNPNVLEGPCTQEEQLALNELVDCFTGDAACNQPVDISDECMGVLRDWVSPQTADCALNDSICAFSRINVGLSVASYEEEDTQDDMPEGVTFGRTFGGAPGQGHAVLAFSHPDNPVCHVAFRGTDSREDVDVDIESMKKIDCLDASGNVFGRCGKGVHEMVESLWGLGVRDEIFSRISAGECPGGVQLSGHSLGGAVASVMAGALQSEAPALFHPYYMSVYTFGEPRMVDDETADRLHQRVNKLRWLNWGDPIPAALGDAFGYKHFGTTRQIYKESKNTYSYNVKHQDYTTYTTAPSKVLAHKSTTYQERLATCGGAK